MMAQSGTMVVMPKRCGECLLTNRKIVSDARRDEILEICNRTHTAFICHKTDKTVCRAFFDENRSLVVRLAKMYNWYTFQDGGE